MQRTRAGRRPFSFFLSAAAAIFAAAAGIFGAVPGAQAQMKAQQVKPLGIQRIPRLEVRILSGEFEQWGPEIVINEPRQLQFRWGMPISAATARWDLADAPFPNGAVIATGTISATPAPDKLAWFAVNLAGIIPAAAPAQPLKYYLRVFPQGANLVPSGVVAITYQRSGPMTQFDAGAAFPSLEIIEISEIRPTRQSLASVDVTVSITNNNSVDSDPMLLKINDQQLLFRQTEPPQSVPVLAPGVSIAKIFRLDAILPPPPNIRPGRAQQLRDWEAQYDDRCGPEFRGLLDWKGPQSQTPIDPHRDTLLPMKGWADYTKLPRSVRICADGECVNLCEMEKAMLKQLDGHVVGYGYVIGGKSPKFGGGGLARTAADGQAVAFTAKTRIDAASVSKMITALGTMRVLESAGVDLFADPIGPYFPSDWNVDPFFQNLSFAQLLGQRSGIRVYGTSAQSYDVLETFFTQTVNPSGSSACTPWGDPAPANPVAPASMGFCYSNYNAGIVRLLLPRAAGLAEDPDVSTRPATLANQYENLVRNAVFEAVGRSGVGCRPTPGDDAYAFTYLYPGDAPGGDGGDQRHHCGPAHWYISAEDMAKVLFSINARDGKILSEAIPQAQFEQMRRRRLGIDNNTEDFFEKNGGYDGLNEDEETVTVLSASAAIFGPVTGPNVIAVLLINSNFSDDPEAGASARQVLVDAYNAAKFPEP